MWIDGENLDLQINDNDVPDNVELAVMNVEAEKEYCTCGYITHGDKCPNCDLPKL